MNNKKARQCLSILLREPYADQELLEATQRLDDNTIALMAIAYALLSLEGTQDTIHCALKDIQQRL